MSGRRKSMSDLPQPASVTVALAEKEKSVVRARTITSHDVKGYTQANSLQLPTVYLNDDAELQRVTQVHGNRKNVGGHLFKGTPVQFENIDIPGKGVRLYERYRKPDGRFTEHTSRSLFQKVNTSLVKDELIDSLKQGPTNVRNLNYSRRPGGGAGGKDDWGVTYQAPPRRKIEHVQQGGTELHVMPSPTPEKRASVSNASAVPSIVGPSNASTGLGQSQAHGSGNSGFFSKLRSMTSQATQAPQRVNASQAQAKRNFFQRLFGRSGS